MQTIWMVICKIFKYSMRILQYTRILIANILFLIFIIICIGIYTNLNYSKPIPNKTALILDITGVIVDHPITFNKFQKFHEQFFNINNSRTQENSLFHIVNIIRQAKSDARITGMILSLKNFSNCNQASLEYIGKALCEFKTSGKPIYAISDYYNQSQYFLASYANKIYLTPQGFVNLKGISTDKLYYKSFLDSLKINTHIFRIGSYKSAVEPFIRNNMSDAVRYEEKIWVNKLWKQYLHTVSINRGLTTQQIFPGINKIINELQTENIDFANYALKNKWVDYVMTQSDIDNAMKKIFGCNTTGTSYNAISMYNYNLIPSKQQKDKIAVICINGPIIDEINTPNSINSTTVINKIRSARYNPQVKAIILRINSPGGSLTASELIRSELIDTRYNSNKPIVVSMGGTAASGGYWIATPAQSIIASQSTLTGSIGIFGIMSTLERSLDAIGIHNDGINTAPTANISITKKLPDEFIKMMQLHIDSNYKNFIQTIAQTRKKTIEYVNNIAQGRIWIGISAFKNGLIDEIGDFDDAINKSVKLANLTQYQLTWYPDQTDWMDFFSQKTNKIMYSLLLKFFGNYISFIFPNNWMQYNKCNELSDFFWTQNYLWNDSKQLYAICLDRIQYN